MLLISLVITQDTTNTGGSNGASILQIIAETPTNLRQSWCDSEISTCDTLCGGFVVKNACDPTTLAYTCACQSNNSAPGLDYYLATIPFYLCQQRLDNCIAQYVSNVASQEVCKQDFACATLVPTKFVQQTTINPLYITSTTSSFVALSITTSQIVSAAANPSPPTTASGSTSSSSNTSLAVGLGAGLGIPLFLLLAGVIFSFYRRKKRSQVYGTNKHGIEVTSPGAGDVGIDREAWREADTVIPEHG